MDEILIEDKKYVSSKRAAKITGYAKDYVGQLCREGRVPARLVGRGWYVLETAIKDHRFGNHPDATEEIKPVEEDTKSESVVATTPPLPPTWEQPRYEATKTEGFPSINRLRTQDTTEKTPIDKKEEEKTAPSGLSWQPWFNKENVEEAELKIEPEVEASIEIAPAPLALEKPIEEENGDINIPIRSVYQLPPEDLLPRNTGIDKNKIVEEEVVPVREERSARKSSIGSRIIQTVGILLTVASILYAILGSGYFDKYISSRRVLLIIGTIIYNK